MYKRQAGIQTTVSEELAKECDIRLLDIDEKCRNKLLSAYPSYSEYTIPANTYTGQTEDIHTLGVKAVLLASDKLSSDTVEHLTEWLFSHAKDLQYATSLNPVSYTHLISEESLIFLTGSYSAK